MPLKHVLITAAIAFVVGLLLIGFKTAVTFSIVGAGVSAYWDKITAWADAKLTSWEKEL